MATATLTDSGNRIRTAASAVEITSLDLDAFAGWLIDLDGTLYRQQPVRLAMAGELLLFGFRHLPIVSRFRREQESLRASGFAGTCPYQEQISRTARSLGLDESQIAPVITQWMERRPGKWLRLFCRRGLLARITAFRRAGGKTALVSDYPARLKLAALDAASLFDEVVACGEAGGPSQLKPSPEGYLLACERLGFEPQRCLVIGDRDDADGQAANAAGMSFANIHRLRVR